MNNEEYNSILNKVKKHFRKDKVWDFKDGKYKIAGLELTEEIAERIIKDLIDDTNENIRTNVIKGLETLAYENDEYLIKLVQSLEVEDYLERIVILNSLEEALNNKIEKLRPNITLQQEIDLNNERVERGKKIKEKLYEYFISRKTVLEEFENYLNILRVIGTISDVPRIFDLISTLPAHPYYFLVAITHILRREINMFGFKVTMKYVHSIKEMIKTIKLYASDKVRYWEAETRGVAEEVLKYFYVGLGLRSSNNLIKVIKKQEDKQEAILLEDKRQIVLEKILKRYNSLQLKKMKELLEFNNEAELELWILELPEEIALIIEDDKVIIPEIFKEKSKTGEKAIETIVASYKALKPKTCYYCGNPLGNNKSCEACKKKVVTCVVCKLPIAFGDDAGKCSLCEAIGHLSHLHESVKVSGNCPVCLQKLPLEEIVPVNNEKK